MHNIIVFDMVLPLVKINFYYSFNLLRVESFIPWIRDTIRN